MATVFYGLSQHRNDTDGPFSVPSGNDDWGPAPSDVRHRLGGVAGLPRDIHATINALVLSAPPFNVTTGVDDNRDTVFNDRPPGAGRNSARGAGQIDVSARVGWTRTFGQRAGPEARPPDMKRLAGEAQRDAIGSLNAALGGGGTRYRLEFYGQIHNLPNYVNRTGFRGVLGSPFFGQATASLPPRRVEIGTRFDF